MDIVRYFFELSSTHWAPFAELCILAALLGGWGRR